MGTPGCGNRRYVAACRKLNVKILSYFFGILFIIIGVLNLFLVHSVPGFFYLLLSLIYFPEIDIVIKKKIGFTISIKIKIILGFVIIWGEP